MSQRDELQKVKDRIRNLSNRTLSNSFTEAETEAAMAMVGKLLAMYNLTMDEIDVREELCRTISINSGAKKRNELWHVAFEIGRFCDCKTWFNTWGMANSTYSFFGKETDILMAEHLFNVVKTAIESETERFKRTNTYRYADVRRTASDSFRRGMAGRIAQRLRQIKAEGEAAQRAAEQAKRDAVRDAAEAAFRAERVEDAVKVDAILKRQSRGETLSIDEYRAINTFDSEVAAVREKANGGSSLIVLKGQLVEQEFLRLGRKIKSIKMKHASKDDFALSAGRQAGEKVNLNRPLGRGETRLAIAG